MIKLFDWTRLQKSEGFTGFFDWLRIDQETIVGIRMSFFDDLPYNSILLSKPYVKGVFENKSVELLFREGNVDFDLSGDQDFTNNYVYESANGEYLFTFGVDHLTGNELNILISYCQEIREEELKG
ncbi:hypothetical protein ECE50_015760 [Chitinophaga sp. Mgbs1]|uniref:Uncharacterized protein n=1 Tax=Chitinophaga solisilvae TaxID=1233460 RepID=A0A9Q5GTB3_9BACT|nr:hypothetical protein [Chitinophaga solisilvae]